MNARTLGFGVLCVLLTLNSFAPAQRSKPKAKASGRVTAAADPLVLTPGDPLGTRSLVQSPSEIRGVESWTIESRYHRGSVRAMTCSPDGRFLATGGIDCTIRIWDATNGQLVRVLAGHNNHVFGLSWSPDGRTLASTGSWDGTVRLWNVENGKPIRAFHGKEMKTPVWHVAWSPDGTRLTMAGGLSGWIRVWNTSAEEPADLMEFGQYITTFEWSPDGSQFALCGRDTGLSVIDFQTAKVAHSLGLNTDGVTDAAWSPDGKLLASAGLNDVTIWEVAADKALKKFAGRAWSVAFSPDGKLLAVGRPTFTDVYDVASGKVVASVPALATKMIWPKSLGQLAMYSTDRISTWKVSEKPAAVIDMQTGGTAAPVWTLYRPIVSGLETAKLSLWDPLSAKHLHDLEGHKASVTSVSWSRDGRLLASGSYDRTARIWDAKSGECLRTLEGHKGAILNVAWSGDGRTLATAGADGAVRLWGGNGESQGTLEGHSGSVRTLAWAPAGSVLASGGSDQTIFIWRGGATEPIRKIPIHQSIFSLAFTTANKVLVLACGTADENLQVLNSTNGQLLAVLKQRGSPPTVTSVSWLPSSNLLFAGRGNYTCQLWDVGQQKVVHNLYTAASIEYVTYAGNGSMLVAGSSERTTRFWSADDGVLRASILADPGGLAMITADGQWRIDPDKPCNLVFVVQTADGQLTLKPDEFAERFRMRNNPARVKLTPR